MEFSEYRIKQLHENLFEILKYVTEICDKNNLTYLLIGGTALGAYRHHTFIPWDDDVDIALPREDYEKLIKILMCSSHPLYSVQNEDNERNYFLPFVKVRKKGTVFLESMTSNLYKNNGIFIDIFPIDTVDKIDSISFKIRLKKIIFIKHILRFRSCEEFYKQKKQPLMYIISKILSYPFVFVSNKKMLTWLKKLMTAKNDCEAKYAINYASTNNLKKEIIPFEIYYPVKKTMFNGGEFSSFSQIERYLEMIYGDYMELPPEEKRHTHEPKVLKFCEE